MVSHSFTVGLAAPRVVFSLLTHLCRRFGEQDVSLMYHVLRSVGAELRAADPAGLRDFIVAVQEQADRRRSATAPGAGKEGGGGGEPMSHRHKTLLQVILEVKNNSQKWSMGAARHAVPTDVVKFVHKSGVGGVVIDADWSKLLDGSALARFGEKTAAGIEDFGLDESDDDMGLQLVGERQDLLKLAAAQRMNTDIRRKVFCAVMGAEDYLDAVDRILSLGLRGAQEREISRIMVDCCLQEKVYNPFYRLVAKSLCAHSKQHRVSFRYALADQIKELGSSESPRRARHLMRLAGGLAADGEVPLLVLQALPWEEGVSKGMQAPLCSFVEAFFLDGSNEAVGGAFLRLSSSPGLETLRNGLALFLHGTFQKRILRAPERQQRLLLGRYKAALSGLNDDGGAW
jgi:nucleolar MIF4G domain-containing protein 1